MDIKTQVMNFESRKHAINTSIELSDEGKRRAMQKLDGEIAAARVPITADLKSQWDTFKTQARRNIEQVQKAEDEAAKQWDYSRLEYMARSVQGEIKKSTNIADVIGKYNQVKESGDKHARRAWTEAAGEVIRAKYHDVEALGFIKQLAQDAAAVIETPQIKELKAQGSTLTQQAHILDEQTKQVRAFYNPRNIGIYEAPDEFTAMREGVNISQHLGDGLAIETLVTLAD